MRALAYAALAGSLIAFSTTAGASDRVHVSDLAGSWHGTFTYFRQGKRPVEFSVRITSDGNRCRGSTEERNTFGDPSASRLYANFDCHVILGQGPARLVFRKIYDGTGGQSHGVDYEGEIASDLGGVTGIWRIGTESGRFSLLRQ